MSERLPVAVIGTGRMGGYHAQVCAESPDVDLVAVVDADAARASETGKKYGAKAAASVDAHLGHIAAAVVAVPTDSHLQIAKPLLERGIHCLVEKPLAMVPQEADQLLQAAAKGRAVLQVGHTERFNPAFMALGRYNLKPRFIETERISPCRFRSMEIGVVMDMMIHDIDLVLSLVRSEIESIDAVGVNVIAATEDMANVRVRFANGCVADMAASRASLKVERRIRIFAENGYAGVDFGAKRGVFIRPTDQLAELRAGAIRSGQFDPSAVGDESFEDLLDVQEIRIDDHDALTEQLAAFVRAVRDDAQVVVTGEDGRRAVALARQIVDAIGARPMGR